MKQRLLPFLLVLSALSSDAQDSATLHRISDEILLHGTCYDNLRVLCKNVGHRLAGSPQAAKAVQWGQAALEKAGADRVWLQAVTVPVWVRGKEELQLSTGDNGKMQPVTALSLGNSEGTGGKVLEAPVVMVNNFDEFNALDESQVKGRIVFFNYRFRQDLVHTFEGYGDAVKYRWASPSIAAGKGAAGVIIRSISTGADDVPHTGSMRYVDSLPKIPEMAIGNISADKLEAACKKGTIKARMKSECHMAGTAPSYNVIGEITGSEHPEQIVLAGGHLDSWDVGEGAHDDGAGCVESIEIIRALKALNIRPKRTIRVILFMNEENGTRGGSAYADSAKAKHEDHIVAIETDAGGFSPRGFGMEMPEGKKAKVRTRFAPQLLPFGVYDFSENEGGADISFLQKNGVPVMGLLPDPQRYFDLHHTNSDVFEAVSHRELKMGAVAMAAMAYLVSEYGL